MRYATSKLILSVTFSSAALLLAQTSYFPAHTFDPQPRYDKFLNEWYTAELRALQEPLLAQHSRDPKAESYRFLWLRTFSPAIAVRLGVKPDSSGTLTLKVGTGESGFNIPHLGLASSATRTISSEQLRDFRTHFDQADFWTMAVEQRSGGTDGSQWIIEAVKQGRYHIVDRWTPSKGPIHDLGIEMAFGLAELHLDPKEIY